MKHFITIRFIDWWERDEEAVSGATTPSELNGIARIAFSVVVEVAGYVVDEIPIVGTAVNLFQSGWSVLQVILDVQEENEEIHYENPRNSVRVDVRPNIYLKYTYVLNDSGYEKLGCVSQSIFISEIVTKGFIYGEWQGVSFEEHHYPNQTINSTSYSLPEETAYLYKNSAYSRREHVKATVFETTFEFLYPTFSWPSDWP